MIKIADSADEFFSNDELCSIELEGKRICIGKYRDEIFAFQSKCPHAGADMSKGYIDPLGNVVCPLHHYKFSLMTGRNISGEGYFLKRYPVVVQENGIYLDM